MSNKKISKILVEAYRNNIKTSFDMGLGNSKDYKIIGASADKKVNINISGSPLNKSYL